VLQNLLDEGVNIRDMRTIIETLAENARADAGSAETLTAQVRVALGRSIVQQLYPSGNEMQVMSLDPQLERILQQAIAGGGDNASIEPGLADTLIRETAAAVRSARKNSDCRPCFWFRAICAFCCPASCGAAFLNSRCSPQRSAGKQNNQGHLDYRR
jgi:flagellar biosynthesis component FlhA